MEEDQEPMVICLENSTNTRAFDENNLIHRRPGNPS